jgi:hypothetical protein
MPRPDISQLDRTPSPSRLLVNKLTKPHHEKFSHSITIHNRGGGSTHDAPEPPLQHPGRHVPDDAPDRVGGLSLLASWSWEFLYLLLATASFVAIVFVLVKFNNKAQPDWPHSINLSALIALLATILRSSLVVVIEESKCDACPTYHIGP